jgi:hypothetical protein
MIVVGATTVAWKCDGHGGELDWLTHAEEIAANADVRFFATLEQDARGDAPFGSLLARLDDLGGEAWRFRWDDGADEITPHNRLIRICAGRNMITDYAVRAGAEWIYFADTDLAPPGDVLDKLLEVDWPIVGAHVPIYCLGGPVAEKHPARIWLEDGSMWPRLPEHLHLPPFGFDVQVHWNTAGSLLVHRSLFRRLRWRVDPDAGMTDDPCYAADALALGWPTLVRKDCIVTASVPLAPVEGRGLDMKVRR